MRLLAILALLTITSVQSGRMALSSDPSIPDNFNEEDSNPIFSKHEEEDPEAFIHENQREIYKKPLTSLSMTPSSCGTKYIEDALIPEEEEEKPQNATVKIRTKRSYVLGLGKWKKRRITYFIYKYTKDLTRSQVKIVIRKAFSLWAKHTNLKFVEAPNRKRADIEIGFETGFHGDIFPFRPFVIAHAFYPTGSRLAGDIHFNDDFRFRTGRSGIQLLKVATHEIGHSLGLGHCVGRGNALCDGNYWDVSKGIGPADIAGIQKLYGKKRRTPPVKPPVDVCGSGFYFDTMYFDHKSDEIYGFKGKYYWKMNDYGVMKGFPKRTNRLWKGLPANVTASFHSQSSNKTYFFKGDMVWRYYEGKMDKGFPRNVSFYQIPSNIHAAIKLGKSLPYVIKGKYAYTFNEFGRSTRPAKRRLVKKLWSNAPSVSLDAALQWRDGYAYLFKRNRYWKVSGFGRTAGVGEFPGWKDFKGIVKPPGGGFPKSVRKAWVGCKDVPKTRPGSGRRGKK